MLSPSASPLARKKATKSKVSAVPPKRKTINFTVDAALLRELGERLVGQPHIALAELVKNSYDADARLVQITIESDRIVVEDNGSGMDFREFTNFWMRIGSPHKQREKASPKFHRPLTGSKGVGRLAVQFLATEIKLETSAKRGTQLTATVDWQKAVVAEELTSAKAAYFVSNSSGSYVDKSLHGTRITLTGLNHSWDAGLLENLARELWHLQAPGSDRSENAFKIELVSSDSRASKAFRDQMNATMKLWSARIRGAILPRSSQDPPNGRRFSVGLEFEGGKSMKMAFDLPNCFLDKASYDVRIFSLQNRQKYGIKVSEARKYLEDFGGVHIYDAGFHLPYYGPDHDWLDIEIDHSHRLSESKVLPKELHVATGMTNLPTQSRIYGVVNVDTGHERVVASADTLANARNYLQIQVSRDRLIDNTAHKNLKRMLRTALDFYAMQETLRRIGELEPSAKDASPRELLRRISDVISQYQSNFPEGVAEALAADIQKAIDIDSASRELAAEESRLLGQLATAGIGALAYQHEAQKQFHTLTKLSNELRRFAKLPKVDPASLKRVAADVDEWVEQALETRTLLMSFADEQNRATKVSLKAFATLEQIVEQTKPLIKGLKVALDIAPELRLPRGSFADWSSIFQNVLINAANATLDSGDRRVSISASSSARVHHIDVQDTGHGLDISKSIELFEPFVRRSKISEERRSLGLGGSGLGLAIVRMVARSLNCEVAFIEPTAGFSTRFRLTWEIS